jgi:hypothetical protein
MLNISTILNYPLLTLLSIGKKSFENMGRFIQRSGDTVERMLQPSSVSLDQARHICQTMFKGKNKLFIIIDDTLIKKIYSQLMCGSGMFFDTKIGKRIMAYRLVIGIISDGKFAIPIDCAYLFATELIDQLDNKFPTKNDIAQAFVETATALFPTTKMIVVVDGLYSTVKFLQWCKSNKICVEARMHSNRVVEYKGKRVTIKELLAQKWIRPKGRQMARTISVIWHGIDLELTIVRRIDKKGDESIVFQIATYKALPCEHVAHYKKRWPVEMLIRTAKQNIGLGECYSRSLETQHKHVASVFLTYALVQLERKMCKLTTPEQAIRRLKSKKVNFLIKRFARFLNTFQHFDA